MSVIFLIAGAMLQTATPAEAAPRIIVEGNGNVKTPPNLAIIAYEVRGEGKTNDEALRALVATAAKIENGLRSMDPTVAPKVGDLTVTTVRGEDCKAGRYNDGPKLSTGACAIVGYVAGQNFTATTTKITDAGTMVGLAGRNGATGPQISKFDIADPKPAKNQAIAAALADARTKAQAMAQGSGLTLGPMISATLDSARDFDLDGTVTVETLLNELPQLTAPSPVRVVVAPTEIETSARVTVAYAIGH